MEHEAVTKFSLSVIFSTRINGARHFLCLIFTVVLIDAQITRATEIVTIFDSIIPLSGNFSFIDFLKKQFNDIAEDE